MALTYAQEYWLPADQVKLLIEAWERFDPSHKTLAVALALLNQQVSVQTIFKAITQAEAPVAQQPESYPT